MLPFFHLLFPPYKRHCNKAMSKTFQASLLQASKSIHPCPLAVAVDRGGYFPGLTIASLKKYPPLSTATAKGHLDQTRANQQSTKTKSSAQTPSDLLLADLFPEPLSDGNKRNACYVNTVTYHSESGQIHTDQTGKFPVTSNRGMKYVFVLYDYDSNSIHPVPIKSRSAESILAAYKLVHAKLLKAGLRPKLHRLDNECSQLLKDFMIAEQEDYQLVPPGSHRRNSAERAIRTYKNHFISGLSSANPSFPLNLWDRLVEQSYITLNLLRGSRMNPKLSPYIRDGQSSVLVVQHRSPKAMSKIGI